MKHYLKLKLIARNIWTYFLSTILYQTKCTREPWRDPSNLRLYEHGIWYISETTRTRTLNLFHHNSVPDANFFSEFTSILESLATFNSQLIIMGDLNVHLEDAMDGDCIKTKQLLESFALVQHVDAPTHSAGGILDVVITRSDCDINYLTVDPPTISDHGLITCTVP